MFSPLGAEYSCGHTTEKNGIFLIEDIAQAHGARWKEKPMGSFGHVSAVSFHPSKNLGAFGDGGAVLTNDDAIAKKIRIFRNSVL